MDEKVSGKKTVCTIVLYFLTALYSVKKIHVCVQGEQEPRRCTL